MIKSIAVFAFAISSLTAFAAEQTRLPSNVIAQVRTAGGFSPVPQESGLRIFADGTVVTFNRNSNPQQVVIARLTEKKVADLRAATDHLRISRLVNLDAGRPICMDAPGTEYAFNTSRAGAMVIARVIGCQRHADQDFSAAQLAEVLKGLQALAETGTRF